MDEVAAALAARLEQGRQLSPRDHADPRVEGLRSGRKLRFGFWKSNRQSGWYVEANTSKKFPFMMVVVRHLLGDKAVIRRGAMIDVELGDADFDRIWRVEASGERSAGCSGSYRLLGAGAPVASAWMARSSASRSRCF